LRIGHSLKILTDNFLPIFLRERLKILKFPEPKSCRTSLNAHTYRLLIFKELFLPRRSIIAAGVADKSFCLSAAEKRDYVALLNSRQLLF
jgi:hypothetical protein